MTYTLDQIQKILEPFPWQQQGLFIEGTQSIKPFMPPLIATVERDDGENSKGDLTESELAHAAYLVHAGNVLNQCLSALRAAHSIVVQEKLEDYNNRDVDPDGILGIGEVLEKAITIANTITTNP